MAGKSSRPVTEDAFRLAFDYEPKPRKKFTDWLREECLCSRETVFNLFPIARWLPNYKVKEDLFGDVISGITVAIMHIPHGLAYSQLGRVPPVVGLYMAVFPLLPYLIMGTSRHISIGTFAVLCAMVGDIVSQFVSDEEPFDTEKAMAVGACCCFIVGLLQTIMSLLRLGSLTVYMSNSLISGFTTGAAFHVFTYQFKNLLGISLQRFAGPLKLVYTYIDLFEKIDTTNYVTASMSACFISFLLFYNYGIKPIIHSKLPKCKVPVPIELIAVALGIIISYCMELNTKYGVAVVEHVPSGLPLPRVPSVSMFPGLIIPSFPPAIVALSINLSLAKIFAKKGGYVVSSKQEILAYGVSNIFGSFFLCLPSAASLSRSVIQFTSGGKTQLASVFSMTIMIFILLFMGPVFEPVPYCVLSSIVLVTILGLLLQVRDVPGIFRLSYLDGCVWVITFLSVVLIDIDYGLLIGFVSSVISLIILNQRPQFFPLGGVPNEHLYLDAWNFKSSSNIPNLLIVKIIGGLNFSNIGYIDSKVHKETKAAAVGPNLRYTKAVVFDFSGVSYIDPTASNGLLVLWKDLKREEFRMFLSSCNVSVYSNLERSRFFKEYPTEFVFATVDDAVIYATEVDVI